MEQIEDAIESADVNIVFLSKNAVSAKGLKETELKAELTIASKKPEYTQFLVPILRLLSQPGKGKSIREHLRKFGGQSKTSWN
jgi:hypothetical protein